jgi:hypothetical protein
MTCKSIAAQRAADIIPDFGLDANKTSVFVDSCTYNFDHRMALSLTFVFNYTTPRDNEDVETMGLVTRET